MLMCAAFLRNSWFLWKTVRHSPTHIPANANTQSNVTTLPFSQWLREWSGRRTEEKSQKEKHRESGRTKETAKMGHLPNWRGNMLETSPHFHITAACDSSNSSDCTTESRLIIRLSSGKKKKMGLDTKHRSPLSSWWLKLCVCCMSL